MATFTVEATGSEPISYQWEEDNAGDNNFVDMVGETSNSITVPNTSTNQYRVQLSNACGTATSNVVSIVTQEATVLQTGDGILFSGFGTQHLITMNAAGTKIGFNYRGYRDLKMSVDSGATYPMTSLGYQEADGRWWATPYRNQQRETDLAWSETDWTGAGPDPSAPAQDWWGDTNSFWNTSGSPSVISFTYSHGTVVTNLGIWHIDMQSYTTPTVWYWDSAPDKNAAWQVANPEENPRFNAGPRSDPDVFVRTGITPLNVGTGSAWYHAELGNDHIGFTYGGEGRIPMYFAIVPKDFANVLTNRVGVNVGLICDGVDSDGLSGITTGGSGRVCAGDGTVLRVLKNIDPLTGAVQFITMTAGSSQGDPHVVTTFNFGRPVQMPCIGYATGEGYVVTAIDVADNTKLLVMKGEAGPPIELDLPVALDVLDQDKQLKYCPARSSWLLAQGKAISGGLEMQLIEIKGI
jgi:hypothetical protein